MTLTALMSPVNRSNPVHAIMQELTVVLSLHNLNSERYICRFSLDVNESVALN